MKFDLESIETKDGVTLHGISTFPPKAKVAIVWVHGLAGKFYSRPARADAFAKEAAKYNAGFVAFNNRGHDIAASGGRSYPYMIGAGFESFTDSVYDIDAVSRFLVKKGIKKIFLVGHSTGCNKVAYYLSQKPHQLVRGGVLVAPICDIAGSRFVGKKSYDAEVRKIFRKYSKKDNSVIKTFLDPGIMSFNRFKSLYTPFAPEDMFPYHTDKPWTRFRKILKPILVCIGESDRWLDRSVDRYLDGFRENAQLGTRLETFSIKGADHHFTGFENKLARKILDWVEEI